MKKIFCLFFITTPFITKAQNSDDSVFIRRIANEVLSNGTAYDLLRQLTKQVGGRLAGSPQFARAVQWGQSSLQAIKPDTVYLQECMVPHWVRGEKDEAAISMVDEKPAVIPLDMLALGNSLGTGNQAVTAEVLAVANFADLEMKKEAVKGKIVYYNASFDPTDIIPGKAYGETGPYRWEGPSRAAKYGAVGVLIRSLTEATDNNPHTGAMTYNDSFPKSPAAAIGLKDADKLWALCNQSPVQVTLYTHGKFLPDTLGHNVIAELKGAEFPNVYITVGGHLDSWDINEGAQDDGAGVVQTMEVLRVLKALGYHPRHSIRFVLFANEENGGRGGEKYAATALANKEQQLFALESDDGGFTPRGFSIAAPPKSWLKLNAWKPLFEPYGGSALVAGGSGADIEPLQRIFNLPAGELTPDNQRYFDIHHARSDVFEAVNKRELLLGAVNMAALIYLVDKYEL
jgi:hypothetical protein